MSVRDSQQSAGGGAIKLLVVGASGQVASALTDANDPAVIVTARGRPELDLENPDSLKRAIDEHSPDVIACVGAYTAVDKAESEPELAHRINALGPEVVAKICAQAQIPMIHVSTDYVFAGDKSSPYLETDPVAPLCVYGRTKLEGEERVAAAWGCHTILRTAWVYSHTGNNFVRTMLRLAGDRDEVRVVGDQVGSPTYAVDLAQVIGAVASKLSKQDTPDLYGVFHSSGEGSCSWAEFAGAVFEASRRVGGPTAKVTPITSEEYPTPVTRPAFSKLDCSKLQSVYGVRQREWRESLVECVGRLSSADV